MAVNGLQQHFGIFTERDIHPNIYCVIANLYAAVVFIYHFELPFILILSVCILILIKYFVILLGAFLFYFIF